MKHQIIHKKHLIKRKIFHFLAFCIALLMFSLHSIGQNDDYKIKTIVIDPGHGGKDPGAIGSKCKEKDIVLAISLKLGKYIEEHFPDIKVIYTRKEDKFIELHKRTEIANSKKADLFISIHANSNTSKYAHGTETYIMGLHKTTQNLEVAKKENAVILKEENYQEQYEGYDPNSGIIDIINSLYQQINMKQSLSIAANIQTRFTKNTKLRDRGVKQAGFLVLYKNTMPCILIEAGFISNREEEKYLMSKNGQDTLAWSIFQAFSDYKKQFETGITLENNTENNTQDIIKKINTNTADDNDKEDKHEVCFKIQIMASGEKIPLDSSIFKGLDKVEVFNENSMYKYVIAKKNSYVEISEIQKEIKQLFPDAFIIDFKNGKKISVKNALKEIKN